MSAGMPGTGLFYMKNISKKDTGERHDTLNIFDSLKRLFLPSNEKAFIEAVKLLSSGQLNASYNKLRSIDGIPGKHFLTGFIELKRGDYDKAEASFQNALKHRRALTSRFEKFDISIQMGLPVTEEIMLYMDCSVIAVKLALVEIYQEKEQYEKAYSILIKMIKQGNDNIVVLLSFAELIALNFKGEKSRSSELIERTSDIENETMLHTALIYYRAKVLEDMKLYNAARSEYTRSFRRKKGRSDKLLLSIQYDRALLYEKLGNRNRFREELEKIYMKNPGYRDVEERLDIQ